MNCLVPIVFSACATSAAAQNSAIAPMQPEASFAASIQSPSMGFGHDIDLSGDTIVVGAPTEDSSATGVNGDQSDVSAIDSGAAYVLVRNGTTWSERAYLKASNTDADDRFGSAVAISGDTIVVGAPNEGGFSTGVDGDENNQPDFWTGAVYVFVRTGTVWAQQAYLKASNTGVGDHFGTAVAISGDTVVVTATHEASAATGINGDQSDNSASGSGAAYVFVRSGTTWSQEAYVKASNTGENDRFGLSVALSGDRFVVGAPYEDSNANHVNGNQGDGGPAAIRRGAAYTFERSGTTWSQDAYLKASNSDGEDWFGWSVGISGDTAVVGAPQEGSAATGVNGDESDNSLDTAGAVYIFRASGTSWVQTDYLKASSTGAGDHFGDAVTVSGGIIIAGALGEDSGASGVNGNEDNNFILSSGAAYVFVHDTNGWSQHAYLKATMPDQGSWFGRAVAASGGLIAIAAPGEDPGGATFVFSQETSFNYCTSLPNSTLSACTLNSAGSSSLQANEFRVIAQGGVPGEPGVFFFGQNQIQVPFGNGFRCVGGAGSRLFPLAVMNSSGFAQLILDFTTGPLGTGAGQVAPGVWNFQFWYRDPAAGGAGFNLSDGLAVLFTP